MKLINPSYLIIEQEPGLEGIYKNIELAARNCYKSEPVEGVTSKDFVDRMIKRGHLSTLEHGTVYLTIPVEDARYSCTMVPEFFLTDDHYVKVEEDLDNGIIYASTNYRYLYENNLLDYLKYLCEPTEYHEKRVTVKFTSNIHFYKDLTRHRPMSFAIESTRYCNYNKNKFENQLTFIIPVWSNIPEWNEIEKDKIYKTLPQNNPTEGFNAWYNYTFDGLLDHVNYYERVFLQGLKDAENAYLNLTKKDDKLPGNWQAQQAAEVLPQATKADIIVTGFVSDWEHIFDLRTSIIAKTGQPHPELARLMDPLYNEFKTKNLL